MRMDVWDQLIAQAKETEKCARIARENIEATAKFWREKKAEEERKFQREQYLEG